MLKISRFTCENLRQNCVTDERAPRFSYAVESDQNEVRIESAEITVNHWTIQTNRQLHIPYEGDTLKPYTEYQATLKVSASNGDRAEAELTFETGKLQEAWNAEWITDGAYHFTEKKVSPVPMVFQKEFRTEKAIRSARIYATAMGIYELDLNGKKVGEDYFAPGFTSYRTRLQYQTYDITAFLQKENTLTVTVAGGWAVGSFVFTRKNRISADRQALLLEARITYEDGTTETIGTDESWKVSEDGNCREADFYDGEVYDSTIDIRKADWRTASLEKIKIKPEITAAYGAPVRARETLYPVFLGETAGELIYDFGQNFAGVVQLKIQGRKGQKILVRHAEILHPDGRLNTEFLRTAQARIIYICSEGEQEYAPRFTYMGFRYISISGIDREQVEISARALYSELPLTGEFKCSNSSLNQLQNNIVWSAKSNFIDIPTDCPQRDERMGWTGDIAVFAKTACFNFDTGRFLHKWMLDLVSEQKRTGGVPNTIPSQGYGFPATMPVMAVDFWGDACILVPWAEYLARGDVRLLELCYPAMKKYVEACLFWAGLFSFGKKRYIWNTLHTLHFGDWVTPDLPKMSQWQKRSKWTATASLKNTSGHLAQIAGILGFREDEIKYSRISEKAAEAYRLVFTDQNGKLKQEFQTGYVLPLYFQMLPEAEQTKAAEYLAELVKQGGYTIGTGFPGTPYILFALADHGQAETAYRLLLNDACPSWLYEVKMGATTVWERWDGLDEKGECPIGDDGTDKMISYNHYASGAVGDFFYRRIAGIEPEEAGYRKFKIQPLPGGGLHSAEASFESPYGSICSRWEIKEEVFRITVQVPVGTECTLCLPDAATIQLKSGNYTYEVPYTIKEKQNETGIF